MQKRLMRLGLLVAVAAVAGLATYVAGLPATESVLIAILVALLGRRPGPDAHLCRRFAAATPSPAEPEVALGPLRVPVRVTPGPSGGGGGA